MSRSFCCLYWTVSVHSLHSLACIHKRLWEFQVKEKMVTGSSLLLIWKAAVTTLQLWDALKMTFVRLGWLVSSVQITLNFQRDMRVIQLAKSQRCFGRADRRQFLVSDSQLWTSRKKNGDFSVKTTPKQDNHWPFWICAVRNRTLLSWRYIDFKKLRFKNVSLHTKTKSRRFQILRIEGRSRKAKWGR